MLVALLLAACGSPDATQPVSAATPSPAGSAPPVDPRDPCALLAPEDIAAVTGGDVSKGEEREGMKSILRPDEDFNPLCVYRTGPPYASVAIYIERPETPEGFRRRMEEDPINAVEIEGLGDSAFIHAGVGLSLLVDDTAISATVQHFDTVEQTREVLTKLGETIVRRVRP